MDDTEVVMINSNGGEVASSFATMLHTSHSNKTAGSVEAVSVAIAANSIDVATDAMHRQYDRFLEVFA